MKVPYFDLKAQTRAIRADLDRAIAAQLDECSFCLGPAVSDFEKNFAAYCDAEHAVGFNSGTSALHVALRILDAKPGDEVITTPMTFVATSWAIVYTGAKPVFVDVDPLTANIDPAKVEAAITPRTIAVMPVHLYGQPCDLDPLLEVCRKHSLPLIEDAAQAHGARYKGKKIGTFGAMSGFSFYPGKNLGACGEAGALVTNSEPYARRAKALREHGSTQRYYHDEIGYNYRMEGIQGAVLGVKLAHLDAWTKRRREIAHRYHAKLKGLPLTLPIEPDYAESVYHLYVIRHPDRDKIRDHLTACEVGTALHYPLPVHLQKCFDYLGHQKGDFPGAEGIADQCLSLPIYPEMSDEQVDHAADSLRSYFS